MSREAFLEALHQVGRGKYHHLHPFMSVCDTVQISFQADEAELGDAIAGTKAHSKARGR
jgi:hypothetical protein